MWFSTDAAHNAWQLGRRLVLSVVSKGTAERSDFYLYYLHGSSQASSLLRVYR